MEKKYNHIDGLTPELLKAYYAGQLSHEQMHLVEKLMLDDPFYAEALEGLEEYASDLIDNDLERLEARLDNKLNEKNKRYPWVRLIAATIFLVIIAGVYWLQIGNDPKPKPIQELKPAGTPAPSSSSLATDEEATTDSIQIDTTFIPEIKPNQTITAEAPLKSEESDLEISSDEFIDANTITSLEETQIAEVQISKPQVIEIGIPMKTFERDTDSLEKVISIEKPLVLQSQSLVAARSTTDQVIKGKVTGSDDGLPLPGVNVLLKGASLGVPTNIDGNFTISIPNNNKNTLIFTYLGYITQEIEVGDQKEINIELVPDAVSLGEVVITAQGISRERKSLGYSIGNVNLKQKAEPINGFEAFNEYLEESIKYPESAIGSGIKGRTTVRLTIDEKGDITKIEITKSLGEAFDIETLKLIQNGPKWKPATDKDGSPKTSEVKLRIRYRERD